MSFCQKIGMVIEVHKSLAHKSFYWMSWDAGYKKRMHFEKMLTLFIVKYRQDNVLKNPDK